ncbi:hypothetical protein KIPB_015460, partial [Kipferlia bialata]
WTPTETDLLYRAVKLCGHNWTRVAAYVRTRTTNQCKMKYHYICTHNGSGGNGTMYPSLEK